MSLCIPQKILNQHVAVLGKTGAGKSSALRHIVEHLLDHKKRVCVIDPKGDWWGLKKSKDGMSAGYDVIAFGDFKEPKATDIPINAQSGKHVAELIANGNRPCVIGFRGWMTSAMVRFWIDFASTLFNANSGELYLVGDEFHNFAPKGKIMDPEAGKCLHWSNRLLSEGRGYGLVCLIASQRPQKVHNDALTCCETLIAMRVIHKADRDATQDWIEGCGDMEKGREVLNNLAGMARGEAYVWSPEIGFGPDRLTFPMFTTFDSFAPPQLQKKISDSGWSAVNLDDVRKKMAVIIEETKANDPTLLKAEIARLKKAAAVPAAKSAPPKPIEVVKEKYLLKDGQLVRLEKITGTLITSLDGISALIKQLKAQPSQPVRMARAPAFVPPPKPRTRVVNGETEPLGRCERKLLSVLSQFPEGCTRGKLILLAGYKWSGGTSNSLSKLRSMGAVEGENNGVIRITESGLEYGPFEPLPEGEALIDFWLNFPHFGRCERELLRVLVEHPDGLEKDKLLELSNYLWSGGTSNALSALRTAGVIVGGNNEVMRANPDLFQHS